MSYAEEMGYDALDLPNYVCNEEHWREGRHYDSNDKEYKLSEMATKHLVACIKRFDQHDTTPLQHELNKRIKL